MASHIAGNHILQLCPPPHTQWCGGTASTASGYARDGKTLPYARSQTSGRYDRMHRIYGITTRDRDKYFHDLNNPEHPVHLVQDLKVEKKL
jgi:hypothetical protein